MTHLRVLGAISLTDAAGVELRSITAQPKRIALLAYLAITTRTAPARRDLILATLWPESDTERGRHALRQALYQLRRSLGEGAIVGNGEDELRVDSTVLECDAVELEAALDAGDPERALQAYRGDLLAGLHVAGASELEQWIAVERVRLQRRALDAALQLADAARSARRHVIAASWMRLAHELAPFDESLFRRYVDDLQQAGDRATALVAFDAFAARLRHDLEAEPSAETLAHIARLRGTGNALPKNPILAVDGPRSVEVASAQPAPTKRRAGPARARLLAPALVFVSLLAIGAAVVSRQGATDPPVSDPNLVLILPFHVVGGPDSTVLARGMVDLLTMRFSAEAGLPAVDPATTHALLRNTRPGNLPTEAGKEMARRSGAGRVLVGSIVMTPVRSVLQARLHEVRTWEEKLVASVDGPTDSLPQLIDELAIRVLSLAAGEPTQRLTALTGTSLPAVVAYLKGQAVFREGRFTEAANHFSQALDLDSLFGPAALRLYTISYLGAGPVASSQRPRALRLAHAAKHRMSARDTLLLHAYDNEARDELSGADYIAWLDRLTYQFPDEAELWWRLGDMTFHSGAVLGLPQWEKRAAGAMQRALVLGHPYAAEPIEHLLDLAALTRDTAALRTLTPHVRKLASAERVQFWHWQIAYIKGDTAFLNAAHRSRFAGYSDEALAFIGSNIHFLPTDKEVARLIQHIRSGRAVSLSEEEDEEYWNKFFELNSGRPSAAAAFQKGMNAVWGDSMEERSGLRDAILAAVFSDGDTAFARRAVERLEEIGAGSFTSDSTARAEAILQQCWLEMWRISRGESAYPPRPLPGSEYRHTICRGMVTVMYATATGAPELRAVTDSLDGYLRREMRPVSFDPMPIAANLVVALAYEQLRDYDKALAAARRRPSVGAGVPIYMSSYLKAEGRLAALAGDTAGAIRAYRHYLLWRARPEPHLQADADQVRAALARLEAASARRTD